MSFYTRTYFDKDTVLNKDSYLNLGANPVAELYCGGTNAVRQYSRYIFHFNENYLKNLYNDCYLGDLSEVTHTLNFYPTFQFYNSDEKEIFTDFQLCLFNITEDWNEGCGYDFGCDEPCESYKNPNCNVSKEPANWYERKLNLNWENEGAFNNLTGDTIDCIDTNCNINKIHFNITDIVNSMITGDTINYGFGIAHSSNFELNVNSVIKYLGLFTKDSNTYFKPYLETFYNHPIKDNRNSFYFNTERNLYLYTNVNNNPVILDNPPIVEITDNDDNLIITEDSRCVSKGIYEVTVNLTGDTESCGLWNDTWKGISVNNNNLSDIEMDFEIKDNSEYFQFGDNNNKYQKFKFSFNGIKVGEEIIKNEIRKIRIKPKTNYNTHNSVSIDDIFMCLYVKQGNENHMLFDWIKMNNGNCENWFYLDTSWLQPQKYFIDFKIKTNGEELIYKEQIYFNIINQF